MFFTNKKTTSINIIFVVQNIREFFIQRNIGGIIDKGKDKNVPLSESDRKMVINHAHAYLSMKCQEVKKEHIIQVAKSLVYMMPCLSDSTEGDHAGYVRIFWILIC